MQFKKSAHKLLMGAVCLVALMGVAPAPKIIHPNELMIVRAGPVRDTMKITGTAEAARSAIVSAQVSAVAKNVIPLPGERVRAGDVILELDTDDLLNAVSMQGAARDQSQISLDQAKRALIRNEGLRKRGALSQVDLEDSQADVRRLEANLRSATAAHETALLNLERSIIRAPIGGVIAQRSVEPGQLVQNGGQVFTIVDLSELTVEAALSGADAMRLEEGMRVTFTAQGADGTGLEAKVARVNPRLEGASRNAKAYLTLPNPDETIRVGAFLTGEVVLRENRLAHVVNAEAISTGEGGDRVFAIRDGRIAVVRVRREALWQNGRLVEVSGDFLDEERVINTPLSGLAAGDVVEVKG